MNRTRLFSFILLLSGLSGISYEILYGRILGAMLGDQFAVSSAVLITFLFGIGLGSKYAHRLWSRLWLIEALIGAYGMAFVAAAPLIDRLLYAGLAFLPDLAGSIFLGSMLLLLPAFLIGCSVPLFAGYLGRMQQAPVFSKVYSIYNFGAAATALLIEFWLIRKFGIKGTVLAFGLANLLAAALLYRVARPIAALVPEAGFARNPLSRLQAWSLILVSIASAVFQLYMVKITELLFGPFRESFALVLAIILFGIAAGSYLVRRIKIAYPSLLVWNLFGLLLFVAGYRELLTVYAALYQSAAAHGDAVVFLKGAVLFALMAIPSISFGATIPALFDSQQGIAKQSGALLAIASFANVAGFLLMALVLHQYLDYGVQLLAISALVAAALLCHSWRKLRYAAAAIALLLATALLEQRQWDENLLYLSYTSFHSESELQQGRKEFNFPEKFKGYQDLFSINWIHGDPYFFINGYISFPMNNPSEKIVGTIGPMFSPKTNQALVLGLGAGSTAAAVGQLFEHTDVVEINPVVRENQYRMRRWNFDIEHNPRVNIIVDDAIHYTKASRRKYDMILNTVTTPLYFSSAKLYTRDFFQMVKSRLNPDGIYLTWIDSRAGSQGAEITLNTLRQSFRNCALVFIKSGYFLLIASDQELRLQHPDLVERAPLLKMDLMGKHQRVPRLLAYNLLTPDAFALVKDSRAPINTIDRPELEFAMARLGHDDFDSFREKLVATLDFDSVQRVVEPAMQYDPAQHVAQVEAELQNSAITRRWRQQGRIYVRNFDSRVDEATLNRYRTIAQQVNDADAHQNLGAQYRFRNRFEDALGEYRKALQLDPSHQDTLYNIALCEELLGRYQEAVDGYRMALQQNPKDAEAPYQLAGLFLLDGQADKALGYNDNALALKQTAKGYLQRGNILSTMGKRDEALAAYRRALGLSPDDVSIQYALARNLAKW